MTDEGIQEPVPRALQARLRRAALDHAVAENRRRFASLLHVGDPGGAEQLFALLPREPADHALRADVVAALLHRSPSPDPIVWVTRSGDLVTEDVDLGWLAGARTAAAEAAVPLTMVVVTRRGWLDPRSGVQRRWRRLRTR